MTAILKKPAVAVFTGGIDKPYALGLGQALANRGVPFDLLGNEEMDAPEAGTDVRARLQRLYGDQRRKRGKVGKQILNLLVYLRLLRFTVTTKARVFHLLWNYRLEQFDRTILMLLFKLMRKRVVLTVHNVNAAERDGHDSALNRWTLSFQYRLADHLFVHTELMGRELVTGFGISPDRVSVIPFGINDTVPKTAITCLESRDKLQLGANDRVVLFFGRIKPYKGLEHLVRAFQQASASDADLRLVIAGEPNKESLGYWKGIQSEIESWDERARIRCEIRHILDAETEVYFKAADVLALPYTNIFQSGVLFLAYNFGLPVIATDAGSLNEMIREGETGFVCAAGDDADLARVLGTYFSSDLYRNLAGRRAGIRQFAAERSSWEKVAEITEHVYQNVLAPVKLIHRTQTQL